MPITPAQMLAGRKLLQMSRDELPKDGDRHDIIADVS
jgi:hypothetical protein